MKTYKTTDAKTAFELAKHADMAQAVRKAGEIFRQHIGAAGVVSSNDLTTGFRVMGVVFDPKKEATLWTLPMKEMHGAQVPRQSLRGGTKEQKAMLQKLQKDWNARFPRDVAGWEGVLTSLGTDWGTALLGGFAIFEHDNAIYIQTGAKLVDHCIEILGSEYEAAREAFKSRG